MELPKHKEQVKKGMEKTAYNMPNLGIFERDLLRQRTQFGLEAAGDIGIYVVCVHSGVQNVRCYSLNNLPVILGGSRMACAHATR